VPRPSDRQNSMVIGGSCWIRTLEFESVTKLTSIACPPLYL